MMKYFFFVVLVSLYPHLCKMNDSTINTSTILHNLSNWNILTLYWKCGNAPPLPRLGTLGRGRPGWCGGCGPCCSRSSGCPPPPPRPLPAALSGQEQKVKVKYQYHPILLTSPLHHGKACGLGQPPAGAPPGRRRTRCRPET